MKLAGKVALITGGNSGIGLATAREFKANGAKIVIFGRSRATLDQAVASLGNDVLAVQGDVRNLRDIDRLFREAGERFGKLDVLVAALERLIASSVDCARRQFSERRLSDIAERFGLTAARRACAFGSWGPCDAKAARLR
jgi:NAD(P)-dependent dehydrogenase (short-subunit alcohol dehydrogenase family)